MMVFGSAMSNGGHNTTNLPILLAGRGCGTLKPGRHFRFSRETPLSNLWVSLLDRMDVRVDKLGDSRGRLSDL
jgi:DNA relaxase NicK